MPKGSSQREKQYNYQASALIRTGNTAQAEQYLMSALYLADNKQIDSVWHSLARLQFLWLQQDKTDSVMDYYQDYLQIEPSISVAKGFLTIAAAFLAHRQQDTPKAIALAVQAISCFDKFPMERDWSQKIVQAFRHEPFAIQTIEPVKAIFPAQIVNLIEAPWLTYRLPDSGFEAIHTAQTLEELWNARLLFFI